MAKELQFDRAYIVYQTGIANVFRVNTWNLQTGEDRGEARLLQGDFRTCESFCAGLNASGVDVRAASCNRAGDVALFDWMAGMADCPFRDSAHPRKAWIPKLAVA